MIGIVIEATLVLALASFPLYLSTRRWEAEGRYWAAWEKEHASSELRERAVAYREWEVYLRQQIKG